jgi:hypothetical protein
MLFFDLSKIFNFSIKDGELLFLPFVCDQRSGVFAHNCNELLIFLDQIVVRRLQYAQLLVGFFLSGRLRAVNFRVGGREFEWLRAVSFRVGGREFEYL